MTQITDEIRGVVKLQNGNNARLMEHDTLEIVGGWNDGFDWSVQQTALAAQRAFVRAYNDSLSKIYLAPSHHYYPKLPARPGFPILRFSVPPSAQGQPSHTGV